MGELTLVGEAGLHHQPAEPAPRPRRRGLQGEQVVQLLGGDHALLDEDLADAFAHGRALGRNGSAHVHHIGTNSRLV